METRKKDNKIREIRIIRKETKEQKKEQEPQQKQGSNDRELTSLEWEAPEFVYAEKSVGWYIGSAVIATLLIVYGVFEQSPIFILLVVVGELLVLFWGSQKPPIIHYKLNESSLLINDRKYKLPRMRWFTVDEEADGTKKLIIDLKDKVSRRLYIYLDSPEFEKDIKGILSKKVPENNDYEEHFTDLLAKKIGF